MTTADMPPGRRKVTLALGAGILLFPFLFVWFLLGKGYSQAARLVGFGWFSALVVIGGINHAIHPYPQASAPEIQAAATPAAPPSTMPPSLVSPPSSGADDGAPLMPDGRESLSRMDADAQLVRTASAANLQCIQVVVRNAAPGERRADVIEAAVGRCRRLATVAADALCRSLASCDTYTDDGEGQVVRNVIHDEVDGPPPDVQ